MYAFVGMTYQIFKNTINILVRLSYINILKFMAE